MTFGIPYSRFFLNLYGGRTLTDGTGPSLLRLYCFYLVFLSVNGLTEAFAQATRSTKEIHQYNLFISKIVLLYLIVVYLFVRFFGIYGIILGNCLNMFCRIVMNSFYISQYIQEKCPNYPWKEFHLFSLKYLFSLLICSMICWFSEEWINSSLIHFSLGVALGSIILFITWNNEKEMIHYLHCIIRLRKGKNHFE